MAFKLRSGSPVLQEKKPSANANALKEFQDKKFGNNTYAQPMLGSNGKTEYNIMSGKTNITNTEKGKSFANAEKAKARQAQQDYNRSTKNPLNVLDLTGVSNWGDAELGAKNLMSMATDRGVKWDNKRATQDAMDIVSAVPVIGKAKAGFDLAKSGASASAKIANKALSNMTGNAIMDVTNKNMTDKNKKSPAMQKKTAAWTRKEGKDPKGGLNAKGVASYRRENPGSKLQTAVTKKPSELKPGSKDAKRRKSFCARMSGMPGPLKKPNGEPTRKKLALDKWNC